MYEQFRGFDHVMANLFKTGYLGAANKAARTKIAVGVGTVPAHVGLMRIGGHAESIPLRASATS